MASRVFALELPGARRVAGGMTNSFSPHPALRLVMFDFDGTLADSIPLVVAAFQAMHERLELPVPSASEVIAMFGPSENGILQKLMPEQWKQALLIYLEEYESSHEKMLPAPFEGVREMLARLHDAEVAVALITGKGPGTGAISLARLDLLGEFDFVRMGEPDGCRKKDHITAVLAEAGVAPGESAYVGDAPGDMKAASACGVMAIGAAWAPTANAQELRDAGADLVFTAWDDFATWIEASLPT